MTTTLQGLVESRVEVKENERPMTRYRRFAPALRHEPAFRALSAPRPNARSLLEWFITGDCTTLIPGLFCCGWRSIMEQLGWDEAPEREQRAVWDEVMRSGYVRYDAQTRLVWLPLLVRETYLPDQPNVLKSWGAVWAELPDCDLKHDAWLAFREAFAVRTPRHVEKGAKEGTAFLSTFLDHCKEPQRSTPARPAAPPANEAPGQARGEPGEGGSGRASKRASLSPSERGSLQDQEQHQRPDPGAEGVIPSEPPPPARASPSSTHQAHVELGSRSMARFQPRSDNPEPSRFQTAEWKPVVLQAIRALRKGGQGSVAIPGRGNAVSVDPTTLDQLYSLFLATSPTDEEMEAIGAIWHEGTFFRCRDPETKAPKQLTPQWLSRDRGLFEELLGLAQTRLRGEAPKASGPLDQSTRSKLQRMSAAVPGGESS